MDVHFCSPMSLDIECAVLINYYRILNVWCDRSINQVTRSAKSERSLCILSSF